MSQGALTSLLSSNVAVGKGTGFSFAYNYMNFRTLYLCNRRIPKLRNRVFCVVWMSAIVLA